MSDTHTCCAQCSVFIVFDPHMREGPNGEPARARNSDIVEDLGMVEYVFSDKTGTLTSNEMQLRMLALDGTPYGSADFRCGLTGCWMVVHLEPHCISCHISIALQLEQWRCFSCRNEASVDMLCKHIL